MKKIHVISIMLIAVLLAGCGTPAGNNGYITPQQISEPKIAEITPTFETQIERVNNCDGANPTYNVSYKTIETQKATFEVTVGAGGLVTGTPVPTVLEVQLEAKITAALAKDYGLTTEKNHDLTLDNPQDTFLEHTIEWKVTRVKGLIEVIYGDGIAQVIFDKIANVELHNRTSQSLGCNGISQLPASTDSSVAPIATLETEPPPTKVVQLPTQAASMEFVKREATGGYVKKTYNVTLNEGEVIVGQGYGFQQQTGGCVAYIIKGSGQFNFTVTDGAWLYYRNVTTTEQIELLLQNQIDSLSQYGCTPSTVKIVRLP